MRFFSIHNILKSNFLAMIGVLLCVYFSYHAISGERSLIRLLSLQQAIKDNAAEKNNVIFERQILEAKVVAMRPGSIEKDLLEERAREVLGYKRPGEVIILRDLSN